MKTAEDSSVIPETELVQQDIALGLIVMNLIQMKKTLKKKFLLCKEPRLMLHLNKFLSLSWRLSILNFGSCYVAPLLVWESVTPICKIIKNQEFVLQNGCIVFLFANRGLANDYLSITFSSTNSSSTVFSIGTATSDHHTWRRVECFRAKFFTPSPKSANRVCCVIETEIEPNQTSELLTQLRKLVS